MKLLRSLVLTAASLVALGGAGAAFGQTATTPAAPNAPVTAPHDGTTGLPPEIKSLLTSFDKTRDAYLATQMALLGQLKNAATAAEREQIRDALQANREAFMVDLKTFRTELKGDLVALKGKISHQEFQRIIDAAYNLGNKEGGPARHHGQP